jgi:hypothetical protein
MNRKWILTGALTFGIAGIVTPLTFTSPALGASRAERERDREKEFDEQIRYSDLPRPVKKTVDEERRDHEVKSFWHVRRDGKEFYRAVIDTKGDDKVIRMKPGGELLTEQDARDLSDRDVVVREKTVKRAILVPEGAKDGTIVDFDRLPGPVKAEIGRAARGDSIVEVVRYNRNGRTMFRAEVGHDRFTRYIRVSEEGKNEGTRGDIDPGEAIPWDRTPGAVKSKIGALAKGGKVDEVIEYKRGGRTYYQAEVDERGGKRSYFYTVDGEGHEVEGLPPR